MGGRGFVCVYYGGTGSSWLLNTLETSPELVIPAYEPLEWMHWEADDATKLAWVDTALDVPDAGDAEAVANWKQELRASPMFVEFDPKPFRVAGFKLSPEAISDRSGLFDVVERRAAKVLAVGRRDRVRHALSLYRAHEEDKHQFHQQGLMAPTKLKKRRFLKWLNYSELVAGHMKSFVEAAESSLRPESVIAVDYEDFVTEEGKTATVNAVASFFEVDPSSMRWSAYQKATPDDLDEAVENYAALQRWVRGRVRSGSAGSAPDAGPS